MLLICGYLVVSVCIYSIQKQRSRLSHGTLCIVRLWEKCANGA